MFKKPYWAAVAVVGCTAFAIVLSVGAQAPASGSQSVAPAATPAEKSAGSGPQPPVAASQAETAGQTAQFKNIKVLKDIPADQLLPSMQFISSALGVDCNYCHTVDKGHEGFALDDKRPKQTARQMMEMTRNINQSSFGGRNQVNCATCHQGHPEPSAIPPVLDEARLKERIAAQARRVQQTQGAPSPSPASPSPSPATPDSPPPSAPPQPAQQAANQQAAQAAADQIFTRYEQAIGGATVIERLTSRVVSGTVTTGRGQTMKLAAQQKAPDKMTMTLELPGGAAQRMGYDGATAWTAFGSNVQPLSGLDLTAMKIGAGFYRDLKFRQECTRAFALPGKEQINGHDANVVRCNFAGNNQVTERLYFDADSGLLVRRITLLRTALGPLPQQTDYSDYREVEGVKIPFTIRQARADSLATRTFTDVKYNLPIDDSSFTMPKPPQKPPTQ